MTVKALRRRGMRTGCTLEQVYMCLALAGPEALHRGLQKCMRERRSARKRRRGWA